MKKFHVWNFRLNILYGCSQSLESGHLDWLTMIISNLRLQAMNFINSKRLKSTIIIVTIRSKCPKISECLKSGKIHGYFKLLVILSFVYHTGCEWSLKNVYNCTCACMTFHIKNKLNMIKKNRSNYSISNEIIGKKWIYANLLKIRKTTEYSICSL